MRECYGQLAGVRVYSNVSMQGNVLFLDASGSHRSNSDCYYEDQGIECENERAERSVESYIKIKFCPFCGRELDSNLYEVLQLRKKKKQIEKKLKAIKDKLPGRKILCQFVMKDYPFSRSRFDDPFADPEIDDTTIGEIAKFKSVKPYVYYGVDHYNVETETLKEDTAIKLRARKWNFNTRLAEVFTSCYVIDEDIYAKLVELKLIKRDEKKLKEFNEENEKLQTDLKKLETQLNGLNKKIKELK